MREDVQERLTDIDVAIEIMAEMIGNRVIQLVNGVDPIIEREIERELTKLNQERDELYRGNETMIKKILTSYAAMIKDSRGMYDDASA